MKPRTALRWLLCLFTPVWLSACSTPAPRPTPVPAPQVIDVPVPAYKPLPSALTAPLAYPAAPAKHCIAAGAPTVCVLDGLLWIDALRGVIDQANADRALAATLTALPAPAPAATRGLP